MPRPAQQRTSSLRVGVCHPSQAESRAARFLMLPAGDHWRHRTRQDGGSCRGRRAESAGLWATTRRDPGRSLFWPATATRYLRGLHGRTGRSTPTTTTTCGLRRTRRGIVVLVGRPAGHGCLWLVAALLEPIRSARCTGGLRVGSNSAAHARGLRLGGLDHGLNGAAAAFSFI